MKTQLLVVLLFGLCIGVSADSNEQQAMLRAFEISCLDCTTMQYGTDPENLTPHICQEGTVCGPSGNAFSCIPEDSAEAASCSCGGKESTYIAEPYDPAKYIVCLPDGIQSVLTCNQGAIFTGDIEVPCATGPECADTAKVGFNALESETESCRKYFFCEVVPATDSTATVPTYECPEGQVYDTTILNCVDPCDLAPEPFACEATDSGPFPDPEDCEVFHICFNGVKIGESIPCPAGQFYSNLADDMKCKEGTEADICTTQAKNVVACYEPYRAECAQK